jgi:hypothetical protein
VAIAEEKYGVGIMYTCELCLHQRENQNLKTFVYAVPICKELLEFNWYHNADMAKIRSCNDIFEMGKQQAICYENHHHNVLVNLERKKC